MISPAICWSVATLMPEEAHLVVVGLVERALGEGQEACGHRGYDRHQEQVDDLALRGHPDLGYRPDDRRPHPDGAHEDEQVHEVVERTVLGRRVDHDREVGEDHHEVEHASRRRRDGSSAGSRRPTRP